MDYYLTKIKNIKIIASTLLNLGNVTSDMKNNLIHLGLINAIPNLHKDSVGQTTKKGQ
jgi:hypothetical protein